MTLREYIFDILMWILFFIVYSIFLWNDISVHHLLVISFVLTSVIKSIYDVINKTGNQKMYAYSEETNQKLRYLVVFVTVGVAIFYHYILFCFTLNYCAQWKYLLHNNLVKKTNKNTNKKTRFTNKANANKSNIGKEIVIQSVVYEAKEKYIKEND